MVFALPKREKKPSLFLIHKTSNEMSILRIKRDIFSPLSTLALSVHDLNIFIPAIVVLRKHKYNTGLGIFHPHLANVLKGKPEDRMILREHRI